MSMSMSMDEYEEPNTHPNSNESAKSASQNPAAKKAPKAVVQNAKIQKEKTVVRKWAQRAMRGVSEKSQSQSQSQSQSLAYRRQVGLR